MFAVPDLDEVVSAAATLGIRLGRQEAVRYQEHLAEHLSALDEFVQARIDEGKPEISHPARDPGHRPSENEDPLAAWLWKCTIKGADDGLLAGRTVGFKDHIAVAGLPLTFGSFAMEGFLADFDATVVTRTLAEGGTIIGKHTMNGFAGGFGFGGGIGDYWRPKNPHNPEHVTGGSSSGSAAAVAAGDVDISFGGDQGGSIRIPAAWSGTVGLKPTFGLVSHFGIGFGSDQSLDFTGPMTRTAADAAIALQAVAGYDGLDPRQGREVPERLDVLSTLEDGVAGIRIGVLGEGFDEAEPDVRDAVMAAVDVLAGAGAEVSKVSIPEHRAVHTAANALGAEGMRALFDTGFFGMFTKTYYPASLIAAINRMWAREADLLHPRTKLNYLLAEFSRRNYHGRVYAKAQNVRAAYVRAYDAALAEVDVLVMPTCVLKAPRYEAPEDHLAAVDFDLNAAANPATRNTRPFNYTGHPALAVPCGKSGGLPVSMQLVGRFFSDPLLLRVAHTYQQSLPHQEITAV
ncbi:amidase family protein [Saccharopolyspora sp. K220]|uniref:amidase family protein n=1 Tax=Saccharopolyspora soli TaxID=2926618 RepID=UPI001F58795A|nr:amidase family protein [Saccharopolyspora soli]MCI2415897.1 amidase family protein [Saccharopolyspora soli]